MSSRILLIFKSGIVKPFLIILYVRLHYGSSGSDGWTLEVRVFFSLATNTSGIGGMVELQILEVNGSEPGNMVLSSSQAVMLSSFSRTLSLNFTLPKVFTSGFLLFPLPR